MPSFEFKPQFTLAYDSTPDDLVFTCGRDEIPPILKLAGIDLTVWQTSYDKLHNIYRDLLINSEDIRGRYKRALFCPCCLICLINPNEFAEALQIKETTWNTLLSEETQVYTSHGIRVEFAKESNGTRREQIVGLKFAS